jgi:glycosyltransferase involved in cell wall biosynthesis
MVNSKPSCGIAMCTCNGAPYVMAQLRSFVEQTRLPDRILISDDRSDDDTWEQLNAWAAEVRADKAIDVQLLRNQKRLGIARNFEQAIRALETDIVFLADQDDVWERNKIEVLANRIELDEDVLLAHSDARLVDAGGVDLGKSLYEALYLTASDRALIRQQRFFEVYCRRNLVTGATTAFRRQLLEIALPFPAEYWIHDEWLAACAAAWKNVLMLPDKLTLYRLHGSNAIGVPTSALSRIINYARRVVETPRDDYLRGKLGKLNALHLRLRDVGVARGNALELLEEAECHFARRTAFEKGVAQRIAAIARESQTKGYTRFSDGFAGMVRDAIHL